MENEKSLELFQELERMESTLPAIEEAEMAVLDDAENRDLFSKLALATYLLNPKDVRIKELQAAVENLRCTFQAPRVAYNLERERITSKLRIVTETVIERSIKKVERLLLDIPPLDEGKVGEDSGGFSMIATVILQSNRAAILEFRRLVSKGVETLRTMTVRPISEIEIFTEEQICKIEKISFAPVEIRMTRDDYGRQIFIEKEATL